MDVNLGDKVQILNGGMDVTNGVSVLAGKGYGVGGPLWATVDLIHYEWETGNRWGLPNAIIKVRCVDGGLVVWQGQPKDIAPNIIRSSQPETVQTQSTSPRTSGVDSAVASALTLTSTNNSQDTPTPVSIKPYVTKSSGPESESWTTGIETKATTTGQTINGEEIQTQVGSGSSFDVVNNYDISNIRGTFRKLNEKEAKNIGAGSSLLIDEGAIQGGTFQTSWQNPEKRRQMLNEDIENIVNPYNFPTKVENSSGLLAARYDYRIDVGSSTHSLMGKLEDKLMEARASLGIPVHGSNDIARAMKYYMYNRFKTPDPNLAHNKSFTHIFFTRPDVNLLNYKGGANQQTKNHTESAILWRRNPELFKLLTDYNRCVGDTNNFNLLLSNQITSFEIRDEELSTIEAGKSWGEYTMMYGDTYTGRTAGEFNCNFTETNDYSVINLIKLWMTYIHNVSKGAWFPSYNLFGPNGGVDNSDEGRPRINSSHVYTKTLDYAASCYVFKCGPDGEDILYWSKYYGIFPVNTGAGALSWDYSNNIGDAPKLNIKFKYSFKRDLNPVSLLEFNSAANINSSDEATYENSFNINYGQSSRPYVGAPFIEMRFEDPKSFKSDGGVNTGKNAPNSSIKLKFRPRSDSKLTDQILYRATLANRGS